jgi:hypothetical protein
VVSKWEKDPNNCGANSCCTCHKNELKDHEDYKKPDSSYKCSECHERHCSIIKSHEPRWPFPWPETFYPYIPRI